MNRRTSGFRLTGAVAAMNYVRARLASGVPAAEHGALRAYVASTAAEVERLCREHRARPDQLLRPTYAAYRYVKDLDLTTMPEPANDAGVGASAGSVTAPGPTAFATDVRADLAKLAAGPVDSTGSVFSGCDQHRSMATRR
jgi:hypothetical protein